MIDIQKETVIPLKEAAARLASKIGSEPHLCSIFRWISNGVQGADGERVHLESVKIGGKRCTSIEAIARFVARSSGTVPARSKRRVLIK